MIAATWYQTTKTKHLLLKQKMSVWSFSATLISHFIGRAGGRPSSLVINYGAVVKIWRVGRPPSHGFGEASRPDRDEKL